MSASISFTPGCNSAYKPLLALEDCPQVTLHHVDDVGHIQLGSLPSPVVQKSGKPDTFWMIPLSILDENNKAVSWRRLPNEDELSSLRYAGFVAIAFSRGCGHLRYLSCRRKVPRLQSALAEFRDEIGLFEVYQVEYSFQSRAYSFKSHNGLYLHYNSLLKTVAFKPCCRNKAKWKVKDVRLQTVLHVREYQDNSCILYVGVLNLQNETGPSTILGESLLDEGRFDREHFEYVLDLLRQEGAISPEKCTIFPLSDVRQQWIVKTNADRTTYVVVASLRFPCYLAVECSDDLATLFEFKYKQFYTDGKSPSSKEKERMAKEIYATHMEYQEEAEHGGDNELDADVESAKERMTQNIAGVLSNTETAEELYAKTSNLVEDAAIFKKRAKKLKNKQRNKLFAPALCAAIGGAVGGIGGWLVGGPAGAAYLGSQTAEIGVGVGAGIAGYSILHSCGYGIRPFWSNTFVRVSTNFLKQSSMRMPKQSNVT